MTAKRPLIESNDVGPGIAWVFEFDEYGRAHALPTDGEIDFRHGRRFIWVHLALANVRSRDWIRRQDAILPEGRELLLSSDSHPRLEWRTDSLWGTTYDLQYEPESVSSEPSDLRFILTPQFLLTARRHALHCVHSVKSQVESGASFESSAALFELLLVAIADGVSSAAQRIGVELDAIEDRVLSETLSDERTPLLRLRRTISRQHRVVHSVRSVLAQLDQPRAETALEAYRALAARVAQRVDAFQQDVHLQAERARILQEEMAAQLASATNRNLFVLTIVTTVLLPPAFVTGFFGMNTKGLPFGDSDFGTLYAAIFCAVAAALVYMLIRRYRMLA